MYFDCFSGAAGDMVIGALIDAGLPVDELRRALGSLTIEGYDVTADRVVRAGISATKFSVRTQAGAHHTEKPRPDHEHNHHHEHQHHQQQHHHEHRSLVEIGQLIDRSALSPQGKDRARALFDRLGKAEAAVHQVPLERVHLHEVGALDSIVDVVGAVFGLEWFGVSEFAASALNVGSGTVKCEHGVYPVPAPATARLLEGVPVYASGPPVELVTPTGALLVTAYAGSYGPMPPMSIERIGYGAGNRDFPDRPNVLRVLVGERAESGSFEQVVVLEFEVDDMNPQIFGTLMDSLYAAGALEVFYAPVQMKKNRPGVLVTIVAPPARREAISAAVFRDTTTIGLRFHEMMRERLDREIVSIDTPLGAVRFKVARRAGQVTNAAPEFDDCAALAARHHLAIKDVQAVATKAFLDSSASGRP
jgi:uncharacterized protein (TIGR00299 family) protein